MVIRKRRKRRQESAKRTWKVRMAAARASM